MINANLERDILQYGLLVCICYELYQTFMSFLPTLRADLALLNIFISIFLLFLYILSQRHGAHPLLLLALHLLVMGGFTFFWKNFGGLAGTVPSLLCVYTSFIMVCSHGWARWSIIGTVALTLVAYLEFPGVLGMSTYFEPDKIEPTQRMVDYLIAAALLVIVTIYMKRKFLFYRKQVKRRYRQLGQIAETLHEQNRELATRQEETRAINENLESMVEARAHEAEVKNQELSEYAFINAHMLRAPLCRMIGLLNLMEKDATTELAEDISRLKKITQEIDARVKEINAVVS